MQNSVFTNDSTLNKYIVLLLLLAAILDIYKLG